jgi:hypothetical protein
MQYLKPSQSFYGELAIRDISGKLIAPDSAPTAYVYYKNAKDTSVFPLTVGSPTATGLYPVTGTTSSSYASLDHIECWTDFTVAGVAYSFQFDEITILTFAAGVVGTVSQLAALLSAGSNISVLSNVNGNAIQIIEKDAYLAADGPNRPLNFYLLPGGAWPTDLTGWTITFTATKAANNVTPGGVASITTTGSVITATGPNQQVSIDLPSSLTTGLAIGIGIKGYTYDVVATNGPTKRITLAHGPMSVIANVTP